MSSNGVMPGAKPRLASRSIGAARSNWVYQAWKVRTSIARPPASTRSCKPMSSAAW